MKLSKEEWFCANKTDSNKENSLLLRAYDTIMNNVYEENGYPWSPYRCISPGKGDFAGIWNWDSAFHALGVMQWDTELAKESIEGFLQFQQDNGLIPDVIWEHGHVEKIHSKPPVFAWVIWEMFSIDKDKEFLKRVYPKLVLNEKYWRENRFFEGLYYYDAENKNEEEYLRYAKNESGWDNSVRWDNGIVNLWAIDLNCFMVMFYRYLGFIAEELGLEDSKEWRKREKTLIKLINDKMWDEKCGYYADVYKSTGELSDVLTPASFMPLFIKIATAKQAEAMKKIAEEKFECKMPTVSFDNPRYTNEEYWRGPTWLNTAYFAAKGLKNYGFEVGEKIKAWVLQACDAEKDGIFENYDSISGKGLCCNHFSWSSVFIIEFIKKF